MAAKDTKYGNLLAKVLQDSAGLLCTSDSSEWPLIRDNTFLAERDLGRENVGISKVWVYTVIKSFRIRSGLFHNHQSLTQRILLSIFPNESSRISSGA